MRTFRLVFLGLLGFLGSLVVPAFAQSNLTYELRIGATRDVALLEEFPESFAGEKVNVTLANGSYTTFGTLETPDVLKPLDFFFADLPSPALTAWGDSIYSYTDAEGITWDTDYVMNFRNKKLSIRLDRSYSEGAVIKSSQFSAP